MTGKWLGSRPIRCNWATKTNMGTGSEEGHLGSSGIVSSSSVDHLVGVSSPKPVPGRSVVLSEALQTNPFQALQRLPKTFVH